MGDTTAIEWCDATFNPWIGCTKVGPGCDNCYAADLSKARLGVPWGAGEPRRHTAASTWKQPRAWNNRAAKLGIRYRVFCASLADVFDNEVPAEWRAELFHLIRETPHLDWLLVTKRIGNAAKMAEAAGGWPENIWLGATIVNQAEADRDIPKLLAVQGPRFRFLSMEPLLGPVRLDRIHQTFDDGLGHSWESCLNGRRFDEWSDGDIDGCPKIDWVIVGGESGPHARPMHPDWARSLRDQCEAAGVPFLFKQWGEYGPYNMEPGVAGFWFDHDGHVYQGPTNWPPADDEPRAYMIRWGKKRAGRFLDGVEHDGAPA